ncbi:hypothetical protein B0H14DRAFT_2593097 [Mycena olivaceomarginata]|nr:hypothetical protein B0H14DRAFT_2593097 [Mycena olivaceomarginata]
MVPKRNAPYLGEYRSDYHDLGLIWKAISSRMGCPPHLLNQRRVNPSILNSQHTGVISFLRPYLGTSFPNLQLPGALTYLCFHPNAFCSTNSASFIDDSDLPEAALDSDEDSARETGDERDQEMAILPSDDEIPDVTINAVEWRRARRDAVVTSGARLLTEDNTWQLSPPRNSTPARSRKGALLDGAITALTVAKTSITGIGVPGVEPVFNSLLQIATMISTMEDNKEGLLNLREHLKALTAAIDASGASTSGALQNRLEILSSCVLNPQNIFSSHY